MSRLFKIALCFLCLACLGWGLELDMESKASIEANGGKFHGGGFGEGPRFERTISGGNRAYIGGGEKEGIEFPISALPLEQGTFAAYVCITAKAANGVPIALLDATGTPPYHNLFALLVSAEEGDKCGISFSLVGEKGKQDVVRSVVTKADAGRNEFHHIAITWKNINSGNSDGEAAVYWDGKLLKSRKNEIISIPAPGRNVFIGSFDLDSKSNKTKAGDFILDEVVLTSKVMSAGEIKALADKLPKKDLADGRVLPGMPVSGGGLRQYRKYDVKDFPVKNGAIFCRFKIEEVIENKAVLLFDNTGSPAWHDRIAMMLKMHADNIIEPYFVVVGSPNGMYISKVLSKKVPFDASKSHTILATWKNIGSGQTDGVMEMWLDGVQLGQLTNFQSSIDNPTDEFRVGGGEPPSGVYVRDNFLTVEECRLWRGEIPAAQLDALLATTGEQEAFPGVSLALPKWRGTFKNDGSIEAPFWNYAASFGPLHGYRTNGLAEAMTDIRAAYDDTNLYVAWKAKFDDATPFGSKVGMRDATLWNQDSVEFHFETPEGVKTIIISAYGDIYDDFGRDNIKWNSDAKFAVGRDGAHTWTGTAIFPLKEIAPSGVPFKGAVCRNIGSWQTQSSSWSTAGFGASGEIVGSGNLCMTGFAFPERVNVGRNTLTVSVNSILEAPLKVTGVMTIGNGDKVKTTRMQGEVLPKATARIPCTFVAHEEGVADYSFVLRDDKGQVIFANRGKLLAMPPLSLKCTGRFYKNELHVNVDASQMAPQAVKGRAKIYKDKKEFSKAVEFALEKGQAAITMDTSSLQEEGEYMVDVVVVDAQGKESRRAETFMFAPKPSGFPQNAGRKPYFGDYWFTPKYDNGKVTVWNRVYTWKDSIFPASIRSGDEELLAETPYFEYRIQGELKRISAASVKAAGGDIEKACFSIKGGDENISIAADAHVEYDGFIYYELKATPLTKKRIDRLSLVFPMRKAAAMFKLQGLETTYSTQRDVVATYPKGGKSFPFEHKLGIGNYDHGLFFCTDSDEGWLPYDRSNVEQIIPDGERVIWRLNIIDGQAFESLPTQRIGFMVTPYKPIDEKFLQKYRIWHVWPGGVFRPTDIPYKTETLPKFKERGVNVLVLHMNWSKYTGGQVPDDEERFITFIKKAHEMGMRVLLYRASITNEFEPSFLYYSDLWLYKPVSSFFGNPVETKFKLSSTGRCPHSSGYIDWWVGTAAGILQKYGADGFYYDFGVGTCNNALHGCGYKGKNTRSVAGESTETIGINIGELSEEDKGRRPTRPVFDQRELWKRMYNMVKEIKGEDGMIDAHTSAPERVFSYPFVDTMWHSESAAVRREKQMDLDMFRLYFTKESLGTRGEQILYTSKDPKAEARAVLSLSLLHRELYRPITNKWEHPDNSYPSAEIVLLWRLFDRFKVEEAEWKPYWSNSDVVSVSGDSRKNPVSLWAHKDKALVVVSNITNEPLDVSVTLKGKLAGLSMAFDAESGKPVPFSNCTVKLTIPGNDFRLLEIK